MKKLMGLLVFALLLTTTTLLFANSVKEIEEIPYGTLEVKEATEATEATEGNENLQNTEDSSTEALASKDTDRVKLTNGIIFVDQHHRSFIEDDQGTYHTFGSLASGREVGKVPETEENKTAEKPEAKTSEAPNDEPSLNEGSDVREEAEVTEAPEASGNSDTSTASAVNTPGNMKNSEAITTVAPTPARSPNVPSYSMSSVGIYHNDEGAVTVVYPNAPQKRLRVLVEKGGERSAYNLHDGTNTADAVATYPLQRGDGTYLVRIMENTEGNSYREVYRKDVTLQSQEKHAVFLNSIQEIKWSTSDPAIEKAAQLTAGMSGDMEKVQAVYDYIVGNVKYDHDKVNQLNIFYLPNINNTFSTNKGICYDYASLFAAMLRSQGIPTRMVKGYSQAIGNGEVYHAWNEVYLAGEDRWVIIDTTHDAAHVQRGQSVNMIKGSGGFSVTHRL